MVTLAARRDMAKYLQTEYEASERRACQVLRLSRSSKRREPKRRSAQLLARLTALSEKHCRMGYRKIWRLLRKEGFVVGRERVRLLRKEHGLQIPAKQRKRKRRSGVSTGEPTKAQYQNHVWTYDFMHDQTTDGRTLRCLTVLDEYTKQGFVIEIGRSLTSADVKRTLQHLFEMYGEPQFLRSDNGSEFTAHAVTDWLASETSVKTMFINPGSPWENGIGESFNNIFRDGCLNRWLFDSVQEARDEADFWLHEYNNIRPHGSLELLTPIEFIEQQEPEIRLAA